MDTGLTIELLRCCNCCSNDNLLKRKNDAFSGLYEFYRKWRGHKITFNNFKKDKLRATCTLQGFYFKWLCCNQNRKKNLPKRSCSRADTKLMDSLDNNKTLIALALQVFSSQHFTNIFQLSESKSKSLGANHKQTF